MGLALSFSGIALAGGDGIACNNHEEVLILTASSITVDGQADAQLLTAAQMQTYTLKTEGSDSHVGGAFFDVTGREDTTPFVYRDGWQP